MTKGVQADPTAFSYTPKDAAAMSKHTNLRRTMAAILRTGRTLSPDFREHVAKVVEEMDHARLISAAPELAEALQKNQHLVRKAQEILTSYLIPDGRDKDEAIDALLYLLDGPEQREVQQAARAALAKAGVE